MKGLVDTNIFLKAILNKETGLPVHGLLSHVMTFDTLGAYHKLMLTSDGGMVLYPTLEQKIGLIKNCLPGRQGPGDRKSQGRCALCQGKGQSQDARHCGCR